MTAILGAGLSGLSAAYYALENPKIGPLVILETSNRVGGWIRSIKQADGTVFEKGPRIIRTNMKHCLDLVEQLELTDKIIPIKFSHPVANQRYIYADNTLHCVPMNFKAMMKKYTLLNRSLSSVIWHDLITKKISKDDESIHSFVERRFGKDVSEKLVAAVFCGISGGDIEKLSAKSNINILFEAEQKHGSVTIGILKKMFLNVFNRVKEEEFKTKTLVEKAKNELWYAWGLQGGFEQFPQALAENIIKRGVDIKFKHNCEQLIFKKDGVELIVNGKANKYSYVISSLPANVLANLVKEQHPKLSKELNNIPTVTMAVVNLQFSENVLPVNAFGFLIPPKEEIPILGVIFDSCALPQNSKMTVLTVMMGGAWFEKYFGDCSSEEHLRSIAIKYVNEILCINEDPKACDVSILKNCIPQYVIGHAERLTRIHDYISEHKIPLGLCGSSYHAIGVPAVILSAKNAVSSIN